jgi:hypothetical protein
MAVKRPDIMPMNERFIERSLMERVWMSWTSKAAVDGARRWTRRRRGVVDAGDDPADLVATALGDRVVEVVPVEEELRAVHRAPRGGVDARDVEDPVARVDGPAEGDACRPRAAQQPRELVADDGALAVGASARGRRATPRSRRTRRGSSSGRPPAWGRTPVGVARVLPAEPVGPGGGVHPRRLRASCRCTAAAAAARTTPCGGCRCGRARRW